MANLCYSVEYDFSSYQGNGIAPEQREQVDFLQWFRDLQTNNGLTVSGVSNTMFDNQNTLFSFIIELDNEPEIQNYIDSITGSRWKYRVYTQVQCPISTTITPKVNVRFYNNVTIPNNPGDTPLQTAVYDSIKDGIQKLLDNCSQCNLPKVRVGLLLYAINQFGNRLAYRIKEIGFDNLTDTVIYYVSEEPSQNVVVGYFQ